MQPKMWNVFGWREYLMLNSVTGVIMLINGLKHSPSHTGQWIFPSEPSEGDLRGDSQVWLTCALLSIIDRFLGMKLASGSRSGCQVALKTRRSSSSVHQLLITNQWRAVISRSRSTKWEHDTQTGKMPEDLLAFTWKGNNDGNIDLIKIKLNFTQATGRRVLFEEMNLQNYFIIHLAQRFF